MPIGSTVVYNAGDLILSTVSSSGNTFQENKIAAATSSIILFNANGLISSQSLNTTTVGTASSLVTTNNYRVTSLTASKYVQSSGNIFQAITSSTIDSASYSNSWVRIAKFNVAAAGTIPYGGYTTEFKLKITANATSATPQFYSDDFIGTVGLTGSNRGNVCDILIANAGFTNTPSINVLNAYSYNTPLCTKIRSGKDSANATWYVDAFITNQVANAVDLIRVEIDEGRGDIQWELNPNSASYTSTVEFDITTPGVKNANTYVYNFDGNVTSSGNLFIGGLIGIGTTSTDTNKLKVNGNISASVVTASLFSGSFSGSIFGTSSWSTNAITSSYLVPTNSYLINNLTASNISASGLLSASNVSILQNLGVGSAVTFGSSLTVAGSTIINNNLSASGNISASVFVGPHTGSTFGTSSWSTNSLTASSLVPTNNYTGNTITATGYLTSARCILTTTDIVTLSTTTTQNGSGSLYANTMAYNDLSNGDGTNALKYTLFNSYNKSTTSSLASYFQGNYGANTAINSGSVALIYDYWSRVQVRPSASIGTLIHYQADSGYLGTGSVTGSITNRYCFSAADIYQGAKATNQYGLYVANFVNSDNAYAVYTANASGNNQWNIYSVGTAPNYFNGNVGIGVTNPSNKLQVVGNVSASAITSSTINAESSIFNIRSTTHPLYLYDNATSIVLARVTNNNPGVGNSTDFILRSGSTDVVRLSTSQSTYFNGGNVGIGTTAPSTLLQIYTGSSAASAIHQLEISSAATKKIFFLTNASAGSYNPIVANGDSGILFSSASINNSQCFFIAPWSSTIGGISISGSGQVGIGTSDPRATLHVVGNISASSFTGSFSGNITTATTASYLVPSNSYEITNLTASGKILYRNAVLLDYSSSNMPTTISTVIQNATGSYNAAFFDYAIFSSSNSRAGTIVSTWNGGSIVYNETCTTDIGNTSQITMAVALNAGNVQLLASGSVTNWNIKASGRYI